MVSFRLRGVHLKLIRAAEHLETLRAKIESFRTSEPYTVDLDRDTKPGTILVRLHEALRPAARWSVIVGDLLYDLRSALDHLAWQLVDLNGGRPGRHTHFPILDDAIAVSKSGKESVRLGTIQGIGPDAARMVDHLQPYTWSDDPTLHPLWILDRLSNQDKHQTLNFVLSWVAGSQVFLGGPSALLGGQWRRGPIQAGDVIAEFPFAHPPAEVDVYPQLAARISLNKTWRGDSSGEALDLLEHLLAFVRDDVVRPFDSTFFSPLRL